MSLKLSTHPYKLKLKYPFTTSRYTVEAQKTMIVSISNGKVSGYGEATVNPYYNSTIEKLQNSVESVISIIENANGARPEDLWRQLEPMLRKDYFALCAIDCAYWDFYAKSKDKTTRSFWTNNSAKTPLSNYTIGIDAKEVMKQKILEKPWPVYKIKLGTENDVAIIKSLRETTNSVFRIDANCAWTVNETLYNAIALKKLGVEFIEQPLPAHDNKGMKTLKKNCVLPLIADESCLRYEDVDKCIAQFHGINIKLTKCGGLTPALKMIGKARKSGLKVMAGCMTESSVGISNLTQIAPLLDYIDADGALLLKEDIANGVTLENGQIIYSNSPGSGVDSIFEFPK